MAPMLAASGACGSVGATGSPGLTSITADSIPIPGVAGMAERARLFRETMNSTSSTLNALLIGVIVVAIMYFGREVLIPLALAGIFSFMLAPLVRMLQHLRIPRAAAVVIVVLRLPSISARPG